MINNLTLLGFGWFVVFYLSFAMLYARAESRLDTNEKAILQDRRHPLRPIPFVLSAGLIGLVALHSTWIWFYLIISGALVIILLHLRVRKSTLSPVYVSSFSVATALLAIGIVGLALSLGYGCGYAL